jgi:hypothetical protein
MSAGVMIVILLFGLNPKDFYFSNNVGWVAEQDGIRFGKYGIAYSGTIKEFKQVQDFGAGGFSIEIALKPFSYNENGFNFILAFNDGNDADQLLIGQWRSRVIVMNGDDYAHRRKTARIAVKLAAAPPPAPQFVTLTTGTQGSSIYLDGRLIREKRDLTLKIPPGGKMRLLLGNSANGNSSWKGNIYGLSFYLYPLSGQKVADHFNRWQEDGNFSFAGKAKPFLLYLFDENKGKRALNHAGGDNHLFIPAKMRILNKKILALKRGGVSFNRSLIQDLIVNFVGFIPFGFVLMGTFVKAGGGFRKHGILIAVVLCFFVSLAIEIVQAWMPSRSSDLLDLTLNTLGGLVGVGGWVKIGEVYWDKG